MVGLAELTGLYDARVRARAGDVPADVVVAALGHPYRPFRAAVAHALARSGDHGGALRLLGEPTASAPVDYAALFANCLRVEVLALGRSLGAWPRPSTGSGRSPTSSRPTARCCSAGSTAYFVGLGAAGAG